VWRRNFEKRVEQPSEDTDLISEGDWQETGVVDPVMVRFLKESPTALVTEYISSAIFFGFRRRPSKE
jgi:hypothetical protein